MRKPDQEHHLELSWQKKFLFFMAICMLFLAGCATSPRDQALAYVNASNLATPVKESDKYSADSLQKFHDFVLELGCTLPPTLQIDSVDTIMPSHSDALGKDVNAYGMYLQELKQILLSNQIDVLTEFDKKIMDTFNLTEDQVIQIRRNYVYLHELLHACNTEHITPAQSVFDFVDADTNNRYMLTTPKYSDSYGMNLELTALRPDGHSDSHTLELDEIIVSLVFMRLGVQAPIDWNAEVSTIRYIYYESDAYGAVIRLTNTMFTDVEVLALAQAKWDQNVVTAYDILGTSFSRYVKKILTGQFGYQQPQSENKFYFEMPEHKDQSRLFLTLFLLQFIKNPTDNNAFMQNMLSHYIFGKEKNELTLEQENAVVWVYQNIYRGNP